MLEPTNPEGLSVSAQPMILMLGTADWNQAIATNQHYMARELASQYLVKFSESLGLRRPEVTRRDISRMFRRLQHGSKTGAFARDVPDGLEVVKPIIVPLHVGFIRHANRIILDKYFEAWLSHPGPRILWTYSPMTYGYEKFADYTVYHCVDLLGEFSQIDSTLVQRGESSLRQHADLAIGSSAAVYEHLRTVGFGRVEHWPNVADVATIRNAEHIAPPRVPGRVVFAGNFSEKKVDFALLDELLAAGVELHLAGPISEGGGKSGGLVRDLARRGAVYHGHLSLPELAELYWTSTVGLIPYALNPYTLGVNPLKTYEYLAAGLRVVSTAVPAVTADNEDVRVTRNAAEFVREVLGGIGMTTPSDLARRQGIAEQHSWVLRGQRARQELSTMLVGLGDSA